MKKILVTGGLGFIGYHLCRRLLETESDTELTIVDNLSSTLLDYSPLQGKARILIEDFAQYDAGDIRYDEVYHLASPVGSLGILKNNGFIAQQIINLALKAAKLAESSNARLIYLSSSEVYGRDGQHGESVDLVVPPQRGTRMEYALGKLTAEHVLLNRSMNDAFEVRIARPFNAMGRWQNSSIGFVIPTFFEAAMSGKPLTVFGTGKQRRSFCLVQDLVEGLLAVQKRGKNATVYNVGNPGNIIDIQTLAQTIISLCNSSSSTMLVDPHQVHGKSYLEAFEKIPDITRVSHDTGWQPRSGLSSALALVFEHYQQLASSDTAACLA